MKLTEAINVKGHPFAIPDCSRDDLPQFFVDMGFKTGAEIGVYKGKFSQKFLQAGLNMFAIDPWLVYYDFSNPDMIKRMDYLYACAKKNLAPFPNCTIIKKSSMEALADIPDASLDFVYIDGHHIFRYVAEDICEWSNKVRTGGVVAGHDYFFNGALNPARLCHVAYVVDAYVKSHGITNWYLLGREEKVEGEKRENCRTWMWIKP